MKDRVALVVAALAGALHLATANRYDVFRDELYFIVCGRHPAFGYADQPPLVPLFAAGLYALGAQTWLLRLPAILAAAGLAALTVAFVRLLGGRDGAAWIAGIAVATAPMLMGLTSTLNTTACEPLCWTAIAYLLARAVLRDERRSLVWAGVVAGVTMEVKYALPLWLAALAIGLLLTPERRIFARRELWIGIALATAIALPSVIWQALHGFPFAELVHNAHLKDQPASPLGFVANQVLVMNPLFAPIWLAGIAAPFAFRDLRAARFLSVAFAVCAVAIVASHGKDYYLTPAYPPLFALGAIAIERLIRNAYVRAVYLGAALVLSAAIAPLALPILSPPVLLAYERAIHLTANAQERADVGNAMPSLYSDMLGWHDFVREVGMAFDKLTPAQQSETSILVDNYGEAAALDIYGAPYHLPPALSGHNQYFLWGLRGQHPVDVLRITSDVPSMRPYCAIVQLLGITGSTYARSFENGKAIAFCVRVHPPLQTLWPLEKMFI
jgi:4-amino-4-deoxy-L-arabinose transferase-like glycosyltransferase